jgi:aspartyl-tRNA(Asn)/glutamyl-tRNA(Gln) amidotransferase subunit A
MTDLATLTAGEMVAGYRRRECSPLEIMRAALDRIEQIEPKFHSIVRIVRSNALLMAKTTEKTLRRENASVSFVALRSA